MRAAGIADQDRHAYLRFAGAAESPANRNALLDADGLLRCGLQRCDRSAASSAAIEWICTALRSMHDAMYRVSPPGPCASVHACAGKTRRQRKCPMPDHQWIISLEVHSCCFIGL
jgi:hypothetical protein